MMMSQGTGHAPRKPSGCLASIHSVSVVVKSDSHVGAAASSATHQLT